jgi:adenylate cyclase
VLHQDGTLQKFIGDAIMAVWGDTHSAGAGGDAARAVRTGLEMREALAQLNALWKDQPDRVPLQIGVGINHGEVICGEMGHPQRMEFTVLGDAINLAARLETATKQFRCDVLVGQSVEELTRAEFIYRRVDLLRLKGKTKPVEVYIPLSTQATPPPGWLAGYHDAIELYRARRFEEAMAGFRETHAQIGGEDFLCQMYLERCQIFANHPPGPDWDGAHTLTEK